MGDSEVPPFQMKLEREADVNFAKVSGGEQVQENGRGEGRKPTWIRGAVPSSCSPCQSGECQSTNVFTDFFHVLNVDSSFHFLKIMKLCGTSHRNQTKHVFWLNPTTKRTEGRLGTRNWKVGRGRRGRSYRIMWYSERNVFPPLGSHDMVSNKAKSPPGLYLEETPPVDVCSLV